jgi:hypothetical protein
LLVAVQYFFNYALGSALSTELGRIRLAQRIQEQEEFGEEAREGAAEGVTKEEQGLKGNGSVGVSKGRVMARGTDKKLVQSAMHVRTHDPDHDDGLSTEKVLHQVA